MAPKKGKNQAKRSNIKIKSKTNPQKRGLRGIKSRKLEVKPEDEIKWYSKNPEGASYQRMDSGTDWINNSPYKKDFASSSSSEADSSGYADYRAQGGEYKNVPSDISDECNCNCEGKIPEGKLGILKRKSSSANYVVAKYLKSGMDHVASFIVESAIRFGKQHGVVIPDKHIPNVYEVLPPHDKRLFDDKCRRIRFKVPEKALQYEKPKKLVWKNPERSSHEDVKAAEDYENSSARAKESLNDIIPLLEKLKKGKKTAMSEVDFKKQSSSSEVERTSAPPSSERERKRQREKDRSRERELEKSRIREMEMEEERGKDAEKERRRDIRRERERVRHMAKERIRKKMRALERLKRREDESGKKLQSGEYSRKLWKKFPQDSLELGRQRLRASTCPRKSDERSETPIY